MAREGFDGHKYLFADDVLCHAAGWENCCAQAMQQHQNKTLVQSFILKHVEEVNQPDAGGLGAEEMSQLVC